MRYAMLAAGCLSLFMTGCETTDTSGFGEVLGGVVGPIVTGNPQSTAPTVFEIDAGLRQALEVGTDIVVGDIGIVDGFWQDPNIRIPLPGRLRDTQTQLAAIGLSGPLDDLQLRMNRAVEQAVPVGKTLVIDAIRSITFEDAVELLRGGNTAATDFLRSRTELGLRETFAPFVTSALESAGAYQLLDQVTTSTPLLMGFSSDFKANMTEHAVQLGLDGLFGYIAVEEQKIRANPLARTTELLKKVFGSV